MITIAVDDDVVVVTDVVNLFVCHNVLLCTCVAYEVGHTAWLEIKLKKERASQKVLERPPGYRRHRFFNPTIKPWQIMLLISMIYLPC